MPRNYGFSAPAVDHGAARFRMQVYTLIAITGVTGVAIGALFCALVGSLT